MDGHLYGFSATYKTRVAVIEPRPALRTGFRSRRRSPVISAGQPVEFWPSAAIGSALEDGDLVTWKQLAAAIKRDPYGRIAREVEEVLEGAQPRGISKALWEVLLRARAYRDPDERAEVIPNDRPLMERSGIGKREFALGIGLRAEDPAAYLGAENSSSASDDPDAAIVRSIRRDEVSTSDRRQLTGVDRQPSYRPAWVRHCGDTRLTGLRLRCSTRWRRVTRKSQRNRGLHRGIGQKARHRATIAQGGRVRSAERRGVYFEALRQRLVHAPRTDAFRAAMIAPVVLVGVGAAAPRSLGPVSRVYDSAITRVAAVSSSDRDLSDPTVIAVQHPPTSFHIAAAILSAPPPPLVVKSPGALGIPTAALSAYRNAERMMAGTDPGCGVSWNLLAGIGRIESMHANGGATDARGTAIEPIYGPVLDGTLPGNEVVVQSSASAGITYARAMGPMQFLPGTWERYASDGDGDGLADPQNLYDSTLSAARYLCSGGLNLRDPSQVMAAILRYNNSMPYAQNVLGWAAAYATGAVPVDLPPLTGPPPPVGDLHLENPEGIGPGLPLNIYGLPSTDPLAQMPLIDLGPPVASSQTFLSPSSTQGPNCILICIGQQKNPMSVPAP